MTGELTDEEKMHLLPWSIAFSGTSSVFAVLTIFGPVFVLFLGELGLPKTRIGLVLSVLPFTGILALLLASVVARVGVKRVFIVFYSARKVVAAFLLLAPWIMSEYGSNVTFVYVTIVVSLFALCRAIAETGIYPWFQEIVPAYFRGRYHGITHIMTLLASSVALAGASIVIGRIPGMDRFLLLIGTGVIFGAVSAFCATQIPGGAPRKDQERPHFQSIRQALGDSNLCQYLIGMSMVYVVNHTVLLAFVPLFMKEQVGLADGQVLLVQVGSYTAGLLSSYLWGWAADRAGSKPVVLLALYTLLLPPIIWLLMPRNDPIGFIIAMIAAIVAGMASAGWLVGDQRLLYVNVVPAAKRTEYMAVFYAWMGLVGGFGPIIAGSSLDLLGGLGGSLWILPIDPYTPLFIASLLLLVIAATILSRLKTGDEIGVGTLVTALLGTLMRGNPFRLRRR